jgi:hypothetical protein
VKVKLLFLLKLLGISLVLFVFLGWIEPGYQIILLFGLSFILPPDQSFVSLDYASYLRLIPFLALMLATPRIKVIRKVIVIIIGITIFIIIDIASILAWGNFPNSQSTAAHLIFSQIWKTTGQWILPFLFWFIAVYKDITELFVAEEK